MANSEILVTGGTGLLGAHLILQLHLQGIRPRAIYRSHIPEIVKDKAEWVIGDILDVVGLEDVLVGIRQVYHVAGYVSFSPKDRETMHKINVEGTANVINLCLDAGIEKLVHVSSVAALGRMRIGKVIDESMNWSEETSNSEYGKTKYLGELEVWRGIGEGLNAVVVNPVIIIGEHGNWEKGSMNIFRNIKNGFKWYSAGSTGFVDADDVSKAMVLLMDSEIHSERFILSAQNTSFRDFFFMVADAFGVKRPEKEVTPMMAAIVWRLEKIKTFFTGKEPLITKETAKTSLAKVQFDNSKIGKYLPAFTYQKLEHAVQRICVALKKQNS